MVMGQALLESRRLRGIFSGSGRIPGYFDPSDSAVCTGRSRILTMAGAGKQKRERAKVCSDFGS